MGVTPLVETARTAVRSRIPHSHLWPALLIALGYYLGAKVGFALTLAPLPVSTLWPPNAVLLAGLLLTRTRAWPVVLAFVFAAHLAVQFQSGVPVLMVLSWFVSNSAEALLGAWLLRRFAGGRPTFETFRDTATFFIAAGLAAPFASSFLDTAFVAANRWGTADYWTVWQTRFFSNVLATLTIVPVILTTTDYVRHLPEVRRWRMVEAGAGLLLLSAICWVVFVHQEPGPTSSPALLYSPVVLLVGAAVRFGSWGAAVSLLTCALFAISGAALGGGPFVTSSAAANARALQMFLIVTWVPIMSLAAVLRERAAANAKARRSEEQLAVAIDAAQLGLWEWDIKAGRLTWSDITRNFYGLPKDAPIDAETFKEFVHRDDRALVAAAAADAVRGQPFEVEFRICLPDGSTKWILSTGRPVSDETGQAVRLVGVKLDITRRKAAEMYMQERRRELARFSRVSVAGELSTALAHEVNQPLAAILANAGAARRYLRHDPPNLQELSDILESIAADNRRASAVITRFGALRSKGEAPWLPLKINDVIAAVVDVARTETISRGVSLTSSLSDDLPLVLGDAVQLQQAILNLVINACDAMDCTPPGARRIVITSERDPEGGVRVVVADTGSGVLPELIEQAFEPFVTSKPERLGLGLAICRSIVLAHEGQLAVQNQPGAGAAFSFTLPGCSSAAVSGVSEGHPERDAAGDA